MQMCGVDTPLGLVEAAGGVDAQLPVVDELHRLREPQPFALLDQERLVPHERLVTRFSVGTREQVDVVHRQPPRSNRLGDNRHGGELFGAAQLTARPRRRHRRVPRQPRRRRPRPIRHPHPTPHPPVVRRAAAASRRCRTRCNPTTNSSNSASLNVSGSTAARRSTACASWSSTPVPIHTSYRTHVPPATSNWRMTPPDRCLWPSLKRDCVALDQLSCGAGPDGFVCHRPCAPPTEAW